MVDQAVAGVEHADAVGERGDRRTASVFTRAAAIAFACRR
jgi:hypothetical protein